MARDCIRAKEAVVESAHATNVVLELTCQRLRNTLNRKEEEKLQKKDKRTLFGDGKAHVVTDDDFIQALEEIDEREKEEERKKMKRKAERAKVKESKEAGRKAWEQAMEVWKREKEEWEVDCEKLREGGCRKKDLPKAPAKPRKAEILLAAVSRGGDDEGGNGGDSDDDGSGGRSDDPGDNDGYTSGRDAASGGNDGGDDGDDGGNSSE